MYLQFLSAVFITTLIVSNIVAVKIGSFFGYFFPVGVIIFPISYILSDVITEVYGYAKMRQVIWTGFFCNLLAVLAMYLTIQITPAPFFAGQDAFASILGAVPRILLASFVAYLCGGFMNAFVMSKLKIQTKGKFLWLRTITSTIIGEGIDSSIFIIVAFWGIFPGSELGLMILTQWLVKVIFETVATPITYGVVGVLKRKENTDHYDTKTNFNPLSLSDNAN